MAQHYEVDKIRYGYMVIHKGTGRALPNLGRFPRPERVMSPVFRYKRDAQTVVDFVETQEGLAVDEMPTREALLSIKDWLSGNAN